MQTRHAQLMREARAPFPKVHMLLMLLFALRGFLAGQSDEPKQTQACRLARPEVSLRITLPSGCGP